MQEKQTCEKLPSFPSSRRKASAVYKAEFEETKLTPRAACSCSYPKAYHSRKS